MNRIRGQNENTLNKITEENNSVNEDETIFTENIMKNFPGGHHLYDSKT